jgi:hypothetical protein
MTHPTTIASLLLAQACQGSPSISPQPTSAPPPAEQSVPLSPPSSCDGIALYGDKAQMARTPRKDGDAERLALRGTDDLVASDQRYQRIASDLQALREHTKDDGIARVFPTFATDMVILQLSDETIQAQSEGSYHGLDCLNAWYGGKVTSTLMGVKMIFISFPGLYNPQLVSKSYLAHPDVTLAEGNSVGGAGYDLTLCNEDFGGSHRYLVHRGSGDCPSGCIDWVYQGYEVSESGEVAELPGWKKSSMNGSEPQPDWVSQGCFDNRYP